MSGISTGVGLISGIPTADLIDQLMQLEAAPLESVQERISGIETEKTAWMSLSASLLGLKLASTAFKETDTFGVTEATSSDQTVLTASAEVDASLGTYQFTVKRLVQAHQLISGGMADSDTTPVGAGTIYFDMGHGRVNAPTELDFLNGQTGVRRGTIRITDWAGTTADIDLTEAMTVADVLSAINDDPALGVQATVSGGSIVLTNTTGEASGTITVGDIGSGMTASDLGLAGSATDTPLVGSDVNTITTDTSLSLLNDRNGIERTNGVVDIAFTLRDGSPINVNLYGVVVGEGGGDYTAYTVGDVIDAINGATGNETNKLVAAVSDDGKGIKLTDTTGVAGNLVVTDGEGSSAATQLGLAGTYAGGAGDLVVTGSDLIADLDSVLISNLSGGSGLTLGTLSLQDRDGASTTVDLTGMESLSEIVAAINNNGIADIAAQINAVGNGLTLSDGSGGSGNLVVADVSGNVAATLGIAVNDAVTEIAGANAEHKYISTQTRLDDLPGSTGWSGGKFRVTNSLGVSVDVNVSGSSVVNIEKVLTNINGVAGGINVMARVNDSGTGIILEDTAGGAMALSVEDLNGGHSAKLLNLRGEANTGETFIDGSFHHGITIDAEDTLQDVADAINAADININAGIVNDGTSTNPYRLILSSEVTGKSGEIIFDPTGTNLDATTFVEARDALVYLGSPGSANAVVLTSSTNQLSDVIGGVSLDLQGTDTDPVTLTISRDVDAITDRMETFVSSFNSTVSNIDEYTQFNSETMAKGVLFGDSTVSVVRSRLMSMILGSVDVAGSYTRLSQVGFSMGAGNTLTFDADEFVAAFSEDRQSVIDLFTQAAEVDDDGDDVAGTGGIGAVYESGLDGLARDYDGFIARILDGLDSQKTSLESRSEQLSDILATKRARLERQFAAMESALAQLQGQQNALASLAQMASSFGSSSN